MNRRVVLIDSEETADFQAYFGLGLGNEIYTIQQLESLSEEEKCKYLSFGPTDGVMLVGRSPFLYLQNLYHFGIRSENFLDCSQIYRVSMEGGAYAKVVTGIPNKEHVQAFLSEEFTKDIEWKVTQKVLHTYEEAKKFLKWLRKRPDGEQFGFDYEASGMPLDIQFEVSGASIATNEYAGFISFTDLRNNETKERYDEILKLLGNWLKKRQSNVWVYNMQYEFQVSHRVLGVTLKNLCDASVINVLDGFHLKKYSLKWTANRKLWTKVWDGEFDRISDLVENMLFEEIGKTKKEKQKILKVTPETFKFTPEWAELSSRYPEYIEEFERLILQYWGNPYMCIPSEILGYYCNLDSFYTLQIANIGRMDYSKDAINVFLDNARLGCLLHSSGLYIDEAFRLKYRDESLKEMAWGITYCAAARCWVNMNKLKKRMSKLSRFHPVVQKLLKKNKFFGGDITEITKYILTSLISENSELGISENRLIRQYGDDFANEFLFLIRTAMMEVKMIKTPRATKANPNPEPVIASKIDETIVRKKKFIEIVSTRLNQLIGLSDINLNDARLINLETYLRYESSYEKLNKVSSTYFNNRENIPEKVIFDGVEYNLEDYSNYISDNLFKCKSPEENNTICLEFTTDYLEESCYLAAIFESTQQLDGGNKFYSNRGVTNPTDAFNHFMFNWTQFAKSDGRDLGEYPEKMYKLFAEFYANPSADQVKEVWSNFNGYTAQEQFFKDVTNQYKEYGQLFDPTDLDNRMFFMRKLVINYLRYKKYAKVLATYIDGMFKKNNVWVIEGPDHIPLRLAEPNEPGAVEKCMVHYEVNTKATKRWSSGFHTIISHADLKDCITTPPAWYVDPFTGELKRDFDYFLTYFDISSAEVKAAGYASGDPVLIDLFNRGVDVYIYTAKLYLSNWDKLEKGEQKKWRKRFKTVFLGVLYGLGRRSLAERLNCSEEEAMRVIEALYSAFPKLREYVESQQIYPLQHDGYVNTMLGDKLRVQEWTEYCKTKNPYERRNLEARIKRLGCNMPIQGGTSSIMASGFFNNIRVSDELWNEAEGVPSLQPIIVVH